MFKELTGRTRGSIKGVTTAALGILVLTATLMNIPSVANAEEVGYITTIAGTRERQLYYSGQDIPALQAGLDAATSISLDSQDNLYIVLLDNINGRGHRIVRLDQDGIIRSIAGTSFFSHYSVPPLNLPVTETWLYYPYNAAFINGSLFMCGYRSILRVDSDGIVRLHAGAYADLNKPYPEKVWDGYNSLNVSMSPSNLIADSRGNVYYIEHHRTWDFRVYRINYGDRTIEHIAGNGNWNYDGDNLIATEASIGYPIDMALDETRNYLYISDYYNRIVRRVDLNTGMISIYAGRGTTYNRYRDESVDGMPAIEAPMTTPWGLALDEEGNLYIADLQGQRVYRVDVEPPHLFTSLAGGGPTLTSYYDPFADDIPAKEACIFPSDVVIDKDGNLLLLCVGGWDGAYVGHRVRKVTLKEVFPSCPNGLVLDQVYDDNTHTITISWSASSDGPTPAGYRVYRDGAVVCDVPHDDNTAIYSCNDAGIADCTEYCYMVVSYNSSGTESEGCASSCIVATDESAPSVPANLAAVAASDTEIALTWDVSNDNCEGSAANYYIYDCGGNYIGSTDTTGYIAGGLEDCADYCFRVSAVDSTGNESAKGGPATARTLDVTPPDCPTEFTASAVSGTEIALSWDAAADECEGIAAGYTVTMPDGSTVDTAGTSLTVTGLLECNEYCFSIAAYDSSGNSSGACATACAKTPWVIEGKSDAQHCGGIHNIGSAAPVKFTVTDEGTGLGPDELGALRPVLYKVEDGDSLTPVDINVVGSEGGIFKYQGGGVWMINVKTDALAPGEYVLSAEPVPNEGSGCSYIVIDPAPYCDFILVEPGGRGKGK